MKIHLDDPYKCDRCGEIFEGNNKQCIGILELTKPMQQVDLCPDCMHQLREWLNWINDISDNTDYRTDIPEGLIPGLPGYPPRRPKK